MGVYLDGLVCLYRMHGPVASAPDKRFTDSARLNFVDRPTAHTPSALGVEGTGRDQAWLGLAWRPSCLFQVPPFLHTLSMTIFLSFFLFLGTAMCVWDLFIG